MARLSALAALLLLLCLSLAPLLHSRADDGANDPDTVVLTDDNFEQFVQADLALVEFYAPWCGHCKALAPEYAIAATQLKQEGIPLGKLDATVHSRTAGSHDIRGYPTLKVFRNGKAYEYNGPRKADGIVAYMRKQVGPAAKPISREAELQALLAQDSSVGYVVVGFFNDGKQSQLQSSFSLLANRMRDEFVFARSTDIPLKAAHGVAADEEAIVAFLHGEKSVYRGGSSKTADVESWIRLHSVPLVGEYSEATAPVYAKRGLPVAKLFLNVDRKAGSKTMTYYTNRLRKLASQFEGKLLVAYADRKEQRHALEHLNAQDEEHAFVIDDLANNKQYKFEADDEEEEEHEDKSQSAAASKKRKTKALDVEGWVAHIEDFLNGDATAYVRSQRAPKNNHKLPVKIATAANFEELVADDKDVLIEFYAPWCGHCKALEPKYEALGKRIQSAPAASNVVVAKLDATANDFDRSRFPVSGYPTIFLKPAGGEPKVYDGARETDAMFQHIKKNARTWKKKAKKNKKQ